MDYVYADVIVIASNFHHCDLPVEGIFNNVHFCTLATEKVRVSRMEPLRPLQETESLPVCDICSFSSILCCSRV